MNLKKYLILALSFACFNTKAQEISDTKMQEIYNEIKTPHKYGLVVVPSDDSKKLDCPTVFRKGNKWYMTYVVFDGRGYETWLSRS